MDFLLNYYYQLFDWAVINANANFFRVFGIKDVQPVFNGSGNTSYNWEMICLFILLTGKKQNDSLFVELKKINRHFQLALR